MANVQSSKMAPFKILIVDDDPNVLDSTALILERAGYSVEKTTEVFGLPLRVGSFRPQMILLDMDLPATRGDTLAKNLRHLRVMSGCRIVFHSASSEAALAEAVEASGAAGYIPKGLRRQEFLHRLRALIPADGESSAFVQK
jgi:two-component system OmpR family response regulator